MAEQRSINSDAAPSPEGGYSQAVEVRGVTRTLHISGQIPVGRDGSVPEAFADQTRLVWQNVEAQLLAAGMSLDNLVKVTTFLSDRRYSADNQSVRAAVLGDRRPALTVVVAGIFDRSWLLEIEAVACD